MTSLEKKRPHNFIDLTGMEFGRLMVVSISESLDSSGKPNWNCKCLCGKLCVVSGSCLRRQKTMSCGCLMIERSRLANTKHGKKGTRVYRIWSGMLDRCLNEKSKCFDRYGGRGILVCDSWLSFTSFYEDMGEPTTPDHTIERKDNNGNYCKANCEWIHYSLQAANRRTTVHVDYDGEKLCAAEADRRLGFARGTISRRISKGWVEPTSPIQMSFSRFKREASPGT